MTKEAKIFFPYLSWIKRQNYLSLLIDQFLVLSTNFQNCDSCLPLFSLKTHKVVKLTIVIKWKSIHYKYNIHNT